MISNQLLAILPGSIRVIRKMSSECLDGVLTFQNLRVLKLIHEGMGPTQMAEAMQISMAAVSKMINDPAIAHLIQKRSGKDRRSINLKLSPAGKKILKHIFKKVEDRIELGMEKLTPKERGELNQGLAVLDKLMKLVKEV